jgi:hypothetical protein
MKRRSSIAAAIATAVASCAAIALPVNLTAPAVYDNVGNGFLFGQVFTSETYSICGVRWFIGDPTRPGNTSVNALEGYADMVLLDATDPANPVELARSTVRGAGSVTSGLSVFAFEYTVPITPGRLYFIGLETADAFGMGLQAQTSSTYAGGYQAYISGGDLLGTANGRDTSFEIITAPQYAYRCQTACYC